MLKRIYLKKILISLASLFTLFLIYLVPDGTKKLENIKSEVTYIDTSVDMSCIFLLDGYNMVGLTHVMTSGEDIESKAMDLIKTLINGGPNEDRIPSGFRAIIPNDTKILSLKLDGKIIKIDFSNEILDVDETVEEKMISAIVYTLTSIDGVDGIIIYVNGNILNKLPKSNITLPSTLDRNFGINKEYDIISSSNITSVTTYFVNKNSNGYYYVPVTKYMNDDREKIKIVIEELETASISNTNLMSFLNSNAKLLSANSSIDTLNLNFNEYLYNDLDRKEILEEVIYTISLSAQDNYNVKDVVFYVNDEEVYKNK